MDEVVRWEDIRYAARLLLRGWGTGVELFRLYIDGPEERLFFWKEGAEVFIPVSTADESQHDVWLAFQPGGCFEMSLGRDDGIGAEGEHFCDLAMFGELVEAVRRACALAAPHLRTETPEAR